VKDRHDHQFRKSIREARARYAAARPQSGTIRLDGRAGARLVRPLGRHLN